MGIVAVLVLATVTFVSGLAGTVAVSAQEPGGTPELRELAERLLAQPYPGAGGQTPRVRLLPGQAPPDFPVTVPVPAGGLLLGSMVRGPGNPGSEISTVVLNAPGTPSDVFPFYEQALAGQGWTAPLGSFRGNAGGFQTAPMSASMLCREGERAWLSLNVSALGGGMSDVRISVNSIPQGIPVPPTGGPCSPPPAGPSTGAAPFAGGLLPQLFPPEGVQLQSTGGGSGGPGRWTSEATAETGLGVTDLEAFFARQLQTAGWTREAGRADGPLAWSIWRVPGEGLWRGVLIVIEGPAQNQRSLSLRLESAAAQAGGGRIDFPILSAPPAPPAPASAPAAGGFAPAATPAAPRP